MSEAMHASIVQAMCCVMAGVEAIRKSGWNEHGKYKFASTDDVYAAVIRLMAENGLVCIPLEDMCEVKRFEVPLKENRNLVRDKDGNIVMTQSQWVHARYSFLWATSEATWRHPDNNRTLYIQVNGPQTFQAIESFLVKQHLRGVFKLPTGDMDLDASAQEDVVDESLPSREPAKRKSSSGAKKDGTTETFNEIRKSIGNAHSLDMLKQVPILFKDEWASMPDRWNVVLNEEYDDRMETLAAKESA